MLPRWEDMVVVGRVARAHGLRGGVVINPETDFPEARFRPGGVVYRAGAGDRADALRIAASRIQRGRPIVAFEGIESIDQAVPLAGVELRVPEAALEPLPENAFYQHDLIGCRVETRAGRAIGTVQHVEGDGGASRLAVSTDEGEVLVPLAADICVSVDVGRKVIVIEPPEGLLDLNRPARGAKIGQAAPRPRTSGRAIWRRGRGARRT